MAAESFYFSVELTAYEKELICKRVSLQKQKNGDLIYNKAVRISRPDGWWHISVGYYNFFDNCEVLYDLCTTINKIKPKFCFNILDQEVLFDFTFIEFIIHIYTIVKDYKSNFDNDYGRLLILPGNDFYKFRRKNRKFFIKD